MPNETEPDMLCADLVRIFSADGIEVQALQGLNLRIDPGELVALVGASGSGKSTLLTILSGLDTATAGVARVAGHDLLAMRSKERVAYRRHTVGFVWQQTSRNLLPYLTAAENVSLAMAVARNGRGAARAARAAELLDLLEVGDVADRRPAELSGGQQQRVAIAVALANSPRVLLADEPTGELDEATSVSVLEAMRSVNEQLGVTMLIVTHDPSVSEHVRRTVQIRDGRTSTEVLRSTRLDEHGAELAVAEEFAVLDRVGRLQLPHEFVAKLDLRDRVRLALEPDHVAVRPGHDGAPPPGEATETGETGEPAAPATSGEPAAPDRPASTGDHEEDAR
ncbi:ATP-binding cassette domain-containing protein [Agromyces aurantiacus]|uniref:ATP-binding cassette domain-containing protein n=1 Tax=Agromyces aurantiacus TaxID=165814 RepID=A0ABV9R187_9MICO|nr:ATP-binding cassette domain-containing protein [Agromyces aurantiacus]MBM7505608.1 ABC-type lipoprotein export system ATPase subunit [Agromyces aurantiacus]